MRRSRARTPAAAGSRVPSFTLYGDPVSPGVDLLHIEDLPLRSRRFRWEIAPHVHQGLYQLFWLRAGQATVSIDDTRAPVEGPAAFVIPSGAVHAFRFRPPIEGQVLTLSAGWLVQGEHRDVGDAFHRLFATARVLRFDDRPEEAARLSALFGALLGEFGAAALAADDALAPTPGWLARAVVWRLAQACVPDGADPAVGAHQALFTRFAALVDRHHAQHWPMTRYAERLGLTVERLNRMVRAQLGRNALQVVHERLTREACRRLIYVDMPVSKLAEELGFEDPAYFCRFFRRRTGVNPSVYRARQAERAAASAVAAAADAQD